MKIFCNCSECLNALLFRQHPKTQVGYSQRTSTLVKTCNISQNLCAEPVTIAIFWIPSEQLPKCYSSHGLHISPSFASAANINPFADCKVSVWIASATAANLETRMKKATKIVSSEHQCHRYFSPFHYLSRDRLWTQHTLGIDAAFITGVHLRMLIM